MGTFEERKVPAKNSWTESRESASEDHTSNAGREKKFMHKGGHHSIADDRKKKKKNDSKEEKKEKNNLRNHLILEMEQNG